MIFFLCTGIYHQTLTHKKLGIDKQMLACRVIPFLIPLTLEPALNLKQVMYGISYIHTLYYCVNLLSISYFKAYWMWLQWRLTEYIVAWISKIFVQQIFQLHVHVHVLYCNMYTCIYMYMHAHNSSTSS